MPLPSRVVFLHGPPACGKYTIGRELAALTGWPLFHNHLVVDMLLTVFPFGSAPFREHRERIWLDVMGDAAKAGGSLIFTFNPERTVDPAFPTRLRERIVGAGGTISFAEITCDERELDRRTEEPSRKEFHKLDSGERYRELKRAGAFEYPAIPSQCRVDSTELPPRDVARQIFTALNLPAAR